MSELAEGARLEIVCAAKSGTEGSNPSLSAITILLDKQDFLLFLPFITKGIKYFQYPVILS
jgi:hypothetical protein